MAFLFSILAMGIAGLVSFVGLLTLALAPVHDAAANWRSVKHLAIAAIPYLLGVVVFLIGFHSDPLWPDQDETPARRAARLAARAFADRVYGVSAILILTSIVGLLGLLITRRYAR